VTASGQPSAPEQDTQVKVPASADYAGEVQGGAAAIAISVHGTHAIAYFCNGASMDAWMTGTAVNGHLTLNGKNGAHLDASFDSKGTSGTAVVDGTSFQLPLQTERLTVQKQKDAGLFRATGMVGAKMVKAGWIVLQNGKTFGSIETSPDSPAPPTSRAPALDLATLTAQDGGTVLVATHISGVTGTGF
jgi:serine/threonine-protein kinase